MKLKYIYITTEHRLCIQGDSGANLYLDIYESHKDTYGVSPDNQNNTLSILKQNRDKSFSPVTYDLPIELLEAIVEQKIIYVNREEGYEIQKQLIEAYQADKNLEVKDALRAWKDGD